MGGHNNTAAILVALSAVLARRGMDAHRLNPWYSLPRPLIRGSDPRPPRDNGQIGTSAYRAGALHDVECRDRPPQTFYLQVSEVFDPRNRFDRASDAAADQDLPVLGLSSKSGGKIAHRADRGVAGAFGEADL